MAPTPYPLLAIIIVSCVILSGCAGTRTTPAMQDTVSVIPEQIAGNPPAGSPQNPMPASVITTAVTAAATTAVPTACAPSWQCSNWSACNTSGLQARSCVDRNTCGSKAGRPVLTQQCTYVPQLPPPGPYTVSITGDTICRQTAENAINNLKYRASPDYEYFRKYVGAVNCTFSDMCYATGFKPGETRFFTVCIASLENPPTVYIDQPFWRADPVWLAGVLVHEACHSEGYQEYILKEGAQYDLTEFSGWKFERRCCDRMRSTWNQLGAPAFNDDLYRWCNL